jgi:DNA helicase-2/ATP-dependent DNA helicase PcrA
MPVEIFSKSEFEAALPSKDGAPLWEYAGLIQGEHAYHIKVTGTNKRIVVRSSVKADGKSALTGKDSIRYWVEYYYKKIDKWCSLGKGQKTRYTTRETNWEGRLVEGLRDCWDLAVEDSKRHGSYKPPSGTVAPQPPQPPAQTLETAVETAEVATKPSAPRRLPLGEQVQIVTKEEATEVVKAQPPAPPVKRDPNPGQKEAIEAPVHAALRCLAGPGSGKTWTLENRVAFLLDHGVKPENLLAVTFSKPMADEMLGRIAARNPSLRGTAAEKQISTIHACCFRILRNEGDQRGVWDKDWMIKKALNPIIEDLWPAADKRPGWKDVYRWIGIAKFKGLTTAEDFDFFEECLGWDQGPKLHEARRRFDQAAANERSCTFPDMLLDVEVRLRQDRSFREKWQAYFKWILIDEGQDTTAQAMRILATLAEPQNQVLIVGDADQLLYRFAGATPEANLYQGFEERYLDKVEGIVEQAKQKAKELLLGSSGPGTVKLTVNYRSTVAIVDACNRLIANNYKDLGGPYEEQYRKTLVPRPGAPEGQPVSYAWFPTIEQESQSVADGIIEHLAQGGEPGDIFVGTRTRAQLGYLEGPLVRAQVPFVNITGGSFWTSKHVADVIAYVRLAYTALNGRGDSGAFKRVCNIASNYMTVSWKKSPQYGEYCNHRFLGRKFLAACRESYESAQYLASNWRFKAGVQDLVSLVQEIQAEIAHAPNVGHIVRYVLDECYIKWLAHEEGTGEAEATEDGKLDDLATVVDVASRFEEVEAFLSHVDEMVRAAQAVKDKDWGEFVVLSTVHRLKGLERPVVYGPGWAEGYDEITKQPRGLLPHTFSLTPPPQKGPLPGGGIGRIEDERCIAFVLISRAKSSVFLSGCAEYRSYHFQPSRFAEELGVVKIPGEEGLDPEGDWTGWTLGDIQEFIEKNPDHPVAEVWTEMLEDGIEDIEDYAEEMGRVLNEYAEQIQDLGEAADHVESTVGTEQAKLIESTVVDEQADGTESTDPQEQAIKEVSTVCPEQAIDNESTEVSEQAVARERTSSPEQAVVKERPSVSEPAVINESTDVVERAIDQVIPDGSEQAKVPERPDVIERAVVEERPVADEQDDPAGRDEIPDEEG